MKKLDSNIDLDLKDFAELTDLLVNIISSENPMKISKDIDLIKSVFYKKFNFKKTSENISENDLKKEMMFKKALLLHKENKNTLRKEVDNQEKKNLIEKENIINEIKQLTEQKEILNRTYSKFRSLQKKWHKIGFVPIKNKTDIWNSYNHNVVKFYDYIKINNELRDIDFSKNLKLKEQICKSAEKLVNETSINKMDISLQDLHIKWKKIGPVKKENREDIWKRFQKISKKLNKKKNDFFIERKKFDIEKADKKNIISKKIKSLTDEPITTHFNWQKKTLECEELTKKWKKIGKLDKRNNKIVWKEFKNALNIFYMKKKDFYISNKQKNISLISRKKEICSEAKKLKLSTDWKKGSDKLIKLQKEWKSIAYTKNSTSLWKDFKSSTDYFFKKRSESFKNTKNKEKKIFEEKKIALIEIKNLKLKNEKESLNILKKFITNWYDNKIIISNKNLNSKFDKLIISKYLELGHDNYFAEIEVYKTKITSNKDDIKLVHEENLLLNTSKNFLEKKLLQYQNNIYFLSNNNQTESLYKEVERKINLVKKDIDHINHKQKILNSIK